jgi:4-hydroxybenzoate polyprenyltransferase
MHAILFACLILFGIVGHLGVVYFSSLLLVLGALFYEHRAARRLDVAGINTAFFQSNAFVSVVFVVAVAVDVLA